MPEPTQNIESKESHTFSVEEIRDLLKKIDGKERPNLAIKEKSENIQGELMCITFINKERDTVGGVECEVSYMVTVAGQRYLPDGSPGRMTSKTFLTKDYDEGKVHTDQLADYINGEWILQK